MRKKILANRLSIVGTLGMGYLAYSNAVRGDTGWAVGFVLMALLFLSDLLEPVEDTD